MTCKSGALTQDGSKSLDTREINSSTGRATRFLTSEETKTRKDKQLVYLITTVEKDNNGMLYILIKLRDHKPRESTKTLDSMSTDHST
jgi:hypothetical protein